jgi:hypothetical protein
MTTQKRRSDWCGRAPLRSPGRPASGSTTGELSAVLGIDCGRPFMFLSFAAGVSVAMAQYSEASMIVRMRKHLAGSEGSSAPPEQEASA